MRVELGFSLDQLGEVVGKLEGMEEKLMLGTTSIQIELEGEESPRLEFKVVDRNGCNYWQGSDGMYGLIVLKHGTPINAASYPLGMVLRISANLFSHTVY